MLDHKQAVSSEDNHILHSQTQSDDAKANDTDSDKLYGEEASDSDSGDKESPFTPVYEERKKRQSPMKFASQEDCEAVVNRSKSKLQKLLGQADIFECLRKINQGMIRSYDELDSNSQQQQYHTSRRGEAQDETEDIAPPVLSEILKIEQQPANLMGGKLRDYQIEGLNWMYKLFQANLNGILADEMGLGKTIQSIAIINEGYPWDRINLPSYFLTKDSILAGVPIQSVQESKVIIGLVKMIITWHQSVHLLFKSIIALVESLKSEEDIKNRKSHHIVIVPKIVLGKWIKEMSEWIPSIRVFCFYGSNEEREVQKQTLREHTFDVMVTTFETVMREKHELQKYKFEYLILDEAQRIKNDESVLRKFKTTHRVLLTGTPLQNNLKELWALLNFLMPKLFDSAQEFKDLFTIKSNQESQEQIIRQIHRLLRPFMLRRLKVDVEKNLPSKQEIYMFIGMSALQKQMYKNILTGNIDVVNGIGDKIKLLNVLMQLKKVCNHPYLFDKVEPGPPYEDGEHLVEACMKFKVLDLLIPKLLAQGCKILIFSQIKTPWDRKIQLMLLQYLALG